MVPLASVYSRDVSLREESVMNLASGWRGGGDFVSGALAVIEKNG